MLSIQTQGFTLSFALYEGPTSNVIINLIKILNFDASSRFLAEPSGQISKPNYFPSSNFKIRIISRLFMNHSFVQIFLLVLHCNSIWLMLSYEKCAHSN